MSCASPREPAVATSFQSITLPLRGQPWAGTFHTTDGNEVQLYNQVLTADGKPFAILQVGQSLTALHALLRQLVSPLLIIGVLALLLCAASSYWLTDQTFAPIHHLIQTAWRIKAGHLHQRVPLPPTHDEIHELALTLNEMLNSLDHTVTRHRRFVDDASRELRTPVAVIRTQTNIALLKPQIQQDYISVLQEINAETERLGRLISDLLALARGDEGHAPFEQELVRLDLVAEATVASLQPLAEERNIQITIHAEQPVTLVGDEARVIQVIPNLLENALRAAPAGWQVSLTVAAVQEHAQLIVCDTGIGIAPEHLSHLFERFYRADPARRQLVAAVPVWVLPLSSGLCAHRGTIAVESQVGQGSSFTVTFPLAPLPSPPTRA